MRPRRSQRLLILARAPNFIPPLVVVSTRRHRTKPPYVSNPNSKPRMASLPPLGPPSDTPTSGFYHPGPFPPHHPIDPSHNLLTFLLIPANPPSPSPIFQPHSLFPSLPIPGYYADSNGRRYLQQVWVSISPQFSGSDREDDNSRE